MDDESLATVAEALPDSVDADPTEATEATLQTLADRITGGQAGDLATYLPRGVRAPLTDTNEDALEFGRDEFLDRIATRAGVERDGAT